MSSEIISINLQNTTTAVIDVSIMGNPTDLADISNQTTEYRWNVTGLTFSGENRISVQYRATSIPDFSIFTAVLQEQSVNGVVSALNTLGIGSFFTFTSGGNTFISNYDNQYIFGVINIYVQGIPQFIYNVNLVGAGGNVLVDVNFVNQLTLNSPVVQSGTITTASGDYIILTGTTTNSPTQVVTLQNVTTGSNYYLGVIAPSSGFGTALFPTPDSTYVFTMNDN
jgi:hypothetical protein